MKLSTSAGPTWRFPLATLGLLMALALGLLPSFPSSAGGQGRQPPTNITNHPDYEVNPNLTADWGGNLHLVYQGGPSGSWHVKYMFKPAGGGWRPPVDLGGSNIGRPRIAFALDGSLHVVFHDNNEVYYRRGASPNGPWGPIQQISGSPGRRSLEAAVACDFQGRVHVVWHDEAAAASSWDIYYRRFENGQWQPEQRISDRSDQDVFPAIAVGFDGQVHVTWCNYQTTGIYYRSRTAQGTWSAITRLDVGSARSLNPHVAVLGWSDHLLVVWHDDTPGNWDIAFAYWAGGTWYGPYFFNHPGVTDGFAQVAWDQYTGGIAITWMDYNNLYILRYRGGDTFEPRRTIIPNYGCKENTLAIDPATGAVHAIAQAKKNGVTNNNSWDLIWVSE